MLSAAGISHAYGSTPVLRDVSLTARNGEILGLIGPNGSGKTTLLRTLYGALTPDTGMVTFDGVDVRTISARQIARQIAVVVQEPAGDLMQTVADTVLMGRTPHRGLFARHSARDERLAVSALERVGALHLASRGLDELSGGEKQRVLMARALVQQAQCLLLDEPTNHLDISYQHQVLQLVRELALTTVVVLHDLNLAARYCDSIVLLSAGNVHATGTPSEVLTADTVKSVYGVEADDVLAADGTLQLLFRGQG
ncbi:ABC transporter ATP-binding protein [Arthrobacter castelli]|uniref:ABC transporter ATP-binding protein n=1 Tax=Arthrobacter castelli TaxID=271431 RepID=UPI000402E905|nr:ABC transporter ATP-binding protein [Arthrobacter castelli]